MKSTSSTDILNAITGEIIGTSTLRRNNNGMAVNFKTSGLTPGYAYTLWWEVWNKPENCLVPGVCKEAAFENAQTAEIHAVLRSHGPNTPGQVNKQINSYEEGRTVNFSRFPEMPDAEGECGDFILALRRMQTRL